jgi:hypothetical protein
MSEDALIGFVYKNEKKLTYSRGDSGPDGLGYKMAKFCNSVTVQEMKEAFGKIHMVQKNSTPTVGQIEQCRPWLNLSVSSQSEKEWYCLLRKTQGDLGAYFGKNPCRYMIDYSNESVSDLFDYIVNLDTEKLEFWAYTNKDEPLLELDLNSFPDACEAGMAMIDCMKKADPEFMTFNETMNALWHMTAQAHGPQYDFHVSWPFNEP